MNSQSRPTILIVEDDSFLKDTYSLKLEQEGFTVTSVSDGPTALTIATSEHPDLIILDLLLPTMDGIQVLKRLRGDQDTRSIPVIIASNVDRADAAKHGDVSLAQDYLVKSKTSITALVDACRRCIRAHPAV